MQRGVFARRQVPKEGSEVVLKSLLERRRAELHDLFNALDTDHKGAVAKSRLEEALRRLGLDPGRADIVQSFAGMNISREGTIVFEDFVEMMLGPSNIIQRAINHHLAIPDFQEFSESLVEIFDAVRGIDEGELPGQIPALTKVDPDLFGVSVCTVDGQIFHHGDYENDVTLQGVILPLLYCVACEELGFNEVHKFVGRRPSGERSDAFILTEDAKPHNPLTNAGGIVTASLLFEEFDTEERFSFVQKKLSAMAGGGSVSFNQPVYLSEKEYGDRNYALVYFMKAHGVKGLKESSVTEALDFYVQLRASQCTIRTLSVIAATLANGGICPITNQRIIQQEYVKGCLAIMYSSGMGDHSGEWAFNIGVPAKSAHSGLIMVVIPNKMGLVVFSPRCDRHGNPVRALEFCRLFSQQFNFSIFDFLMSGDQRGDEDSD